MKNNRPPQTSELAFRLKTYLPDIKKADVKLTVERAPSLHAPIVPPQIGMTPHRNPTQLPTLAPVAPTKHEPLDDGGVWVMLVLLILITSTAFYLFWAKLATSWPFGL